MDLSKHVFSNFLQAGWLLSAMFLCAAFLAGPGDGRERKDEAKVVHSAAGDSVGDSGGQLRIPAGTILPVRLNATISSGKAKAGQVITGRIMQDVPLAGGARIAAGTKVVGHIVEKVAGSAGAPGHVSLQFDRVVTAHQTIAISTNLRAIAGFMRIAEAQVPLSGTGETEVYRWLTTVQIGGDVVYGEGGPVTSGENPNEIIGKKVNDGVLGYVKAKQGTKCRGELDGNESPQALWVFSADACGTYGMEHISIAHAGRTEPVGVIVLASDKDGLKIAGGTGMLLRVDASTGN
jgi:hypothetical protein